MRAFLLVGLVLMAAVALVGEAGAARAAVTAPDGTIAFDGGQGASSTLVQCPAGSECVDLVARCQIVASTEDLDTATLRGRFEPNYNSAWFLDAATGTWQGDSPAFGAALSGPNDLAGVAKLDSFFVCMPEGGGTFERAAI